MSGSVKPLVVPVTVFLVIVSVGVVATWPSGPAEAEYYQHFQDGKSPYALLGSRIDRGDSLQELRKSSAAESRWKRWKTSNPCLIICGEGRDEVASLAGVERVIQVKAGD